MTSEMGTDRRRCQFSNWMSSSQFQCHLDAIYDTKMRMRLFAYQVSETAQGGCRCTS
jgi:hypothetical protein